MFFICYHSGNWYAFWITRWYIKRSDMWIPNIWNISLTLVEMRLRKERNLQREKVNDARFLKRFFFIDDFHWDRNFYIIFSLRQEFLYGIAFHFIARDNFNKSSHLHVMTHRNDIKNFDNHVQSLSSISWHIVFTHLLGTFLFLNRF